MSRRFLVVPAALALLSMVTPASAAIYSYRISATEAEECPAPPSPSSASATGDVTINTTTNTISYDIFYTSISGTFSAAHFHGFTGVCPATTGIKVTLTPNGAGRLTGSAVYPEGDEASYLGGQSYFNLHTSSNPGGQIRDQLVPVEAGALPGSSPMAMALLASVLGASGILWVMRRHRTA